MRISPLMAIPLAGVIAGTIDIGAACLINLLSPVVILHAIASGVLGKASFHGGMHSAALGLVLQWGMSILIASIYIVPAQAIGALRRHWLALGLAYGVGIFIVMNFVVVPLSNAGFKAPHVTPKSALDMLAMLLFGVIVSRFARATEA